MANNIRKRINNINSQLKHLYQDTYKTRIDNRDNMDGIVNSIDNNIDKLLSKINDRSVSDISSVILRLNNKSNSTIDEITDSIEGMFNNGQLIDTLNMESISRSIQAEDYQYDLICKYMPKLEDALEIKKDNVLSSDNFTKDFLNALSDKTNKEFIQQFNDRSKKIIDKYDFQELCEEIYDDCSHYGEYFLYQVPYRKAFERLIKRKEKMNNSLVGSVQAYRYESTTILESGNIGSKVQDLGQKFISECISDDFEVQITLDDSSMISSIIDYISIKESIKDKTSSIKTEFISESKKVESGGNIKNTFGFNTLIAPDGFIDSNKNKKDDKIKEINGCVMYKIPRDQIFPICVGDDAVLGYIYIEQKSDEIINSVSNGSTYNSLTNRSISLSEEEYDAQNDMLVAYIAAQMSELIDAKFINANVDLKEEIYAILRYNDHFCTTHGANNISVSFLSTEDVKHIYFKKDKRTHRGISDLKRAVVPAMLYCLLYLSDVIGKISRAQDKRIYYVKQTIETNVARTLLNVINQIKRGNMGMRQLENMNTIFNIIGKYNDHVIPVGQNGESPIQFEVMQGQQVETPTDLMDRMEESAINTTDVPLEFIQSIMQVDYSSRFTMSNSKFLRKIFKRQRICQNHFSSIFRDLYNFEYNENEYNIKILLPAPIFLTLTNSAQIINNNREYVQALVDTMLPNEEEEVKNEVISIMARKQLGTYIDFDMFDNILNEAKHIVDYNKTLNQDVSVDDSEEY